MAVIVILVGVFLMGLQVGRGVLMARGAPGAENAAGATEAEPPPPPASASPGSSTLPATAKEKLSYAERLGAPEPPKETLKPETASPPATPPTPRSDAPGPAASAPPRTKTAPVLTKTAPPAKTAAATPTTKADPPATSAEPSGPGFAIQVAAVREAGEADAMVKRLAAKGYSAYVFRPAKSDGIYRVRVGKFKDRREADTVAARLQKEEQFKPWIVR
jgi:cell division septation protein DedD